MDSEQAGATAAHCRTLGIVSSVYAVGLLLLALVATQGPDAAIHAWLDLIVLGVIALGAGAMKPCLSPLGADQFEATETRMITIYWSCFYFAVNVSRWALW